MKGKILGAGAISGEDGVRYYYDESELKNLKEGQKCEGCEVDFEVKDGKAVGVYITKGNGFGADFGKVGSNVSASLEKLNLPRFEGKIFWDLNEAKSNILRANMHSAKLWMLLITILSLMNAIKLGMDDGSQFNLSDAYSWVSGVAGTAMFLWASYCLSVLSNPYKLFKFTLIALVSFWIFMWLCDELFIALFMTGLDYAFSGRGSVPIFKIIFFIVFGVITLRYTLKSFKLLSQITEQRAYMWALYVSIAVAIIGVGVYLIEMSGERPRVGHAIETILNFINLTYISFAALFAWATLRFRVIKAV